MQTRKLGLTLILLMLTACKPASEPTTPAVRTLLDAAAQGHMQSLDNFLQGTALIDMHDGCKLTALMHAALNGHLAAVEKLLQKGAAVNLTDKGGYSALMLAASNNHTDIVKVLLDWGAEINQAEITQGYTALIWASRLGHTQTVEALLAHQADATIRDLAGQTAMDYAAELNPDLLPLFASTLTQG